MCPGSTSLLDATRKFLIGMRRDLQAGCWQQRAVGYNRCNKDHLQQWVGTRVWLVGFWGI